MTLERIRSHILEQAKSQAGQMVNETELNAAARLKQVHKDESEKLEADVAALERGLERVRQQELAKRRTECRAELLRIKTDIIDRVFTDVVGKILAGEVYRNWLRGKLNKVGRINAQIICRGEDRALIAQLLGELGHEQMSFVEDEQPPMGGFVLRTKNYDMDVTLQAELVGLREELTPELVDRISGGDSRSEPA